MALHPLMKAFDEALYEEAHLRKAYGDLDLDEVLPPDLAMQELRRWSFGMPGWSLHVDSSWQPGSVMIRTTALTADSLGRAGAQVILSGGASVSLSGLTRRKIARTIRQLITNLVLHEAMEWLKRDGVTVFNPHNEPAPSLN